MEILAECSKCKVDDTKNNVTGTEGMTCMPQTDDVKEEAKKAADRGKDPPAMGCDCK